MNAGVDDRWEGYVPWFIRHTAAPSLGDFDTFFSRVSQRLYRLMTFNEGEIVNLDHFGTRLETDALQRYRHTVGKPLGDQLRYFFDTALIRQTVDGVTLSDPEERRISEIQIRDALRRFSPGTPPPDSDEVQRARRVAEETRPARRARHFNRVVMQRLGVLETILVALHAVHARDGALSDLIRDLRRALAEARIPLDIRGMPPSIIPMDDVLLQEGVVDPALARVRARWPERADELLGAYHDVIAGRKLDEVFGRAFKSLEEIARALTDDSTFDFSPKDLQRHFPDLHPTVKLTIEKLRVYRGDAASHGRKSPNPREIRYLLFQVCNIVFLLLDLESEDSG